MSKTEAQAAAANEAPFVHEVKQAVTGFVSEFKGFRAEIETRIQQTEERVTMLDRKSQIAARPQLAGAVDMDAPHKKAFDAYLRTGDDDGLRGLEFESKSLSTAVNSDGGYLVDPATSESIKSVLSSTASLRARHTWARCVLPEPGGPCTQSAGPGQLGQASIQATASSLQGAMRKSSCPMAAR